MEQIELLQKQSRKAKLLIDKQDEVLRCKFYSFLDEFEGGRIPDLVELYRFLVERLGIMDVKSFVVEIEFLEERIVNHEGDIEPMASVLNGFILHIKFPKTSYSHPQNLDDSRSEINNLTDSGARQKKRLKQLKVQNLDDSGTPMNVQKGMDVNCGSYLQNYTRSAVMKKKLPVSQIDRALRNLFTVRMRLGLFNGSPKNLTSRKNLLSSFDKQVHVELVPAQLLIDGNRKSAKGEIWQCC
ncbi:hypothetical protein POM88_010360 [Heracleum sosnowskyi]|uniref:Uncharacterized protein n=1 Tax=Heracleum sosnowskyi TaxID=360622 RepID=A0AAD8IU90_9APIA|nr:hypothetical protein POM88_010360 [Heracleum sosnowskyi]